MHQPPPSNEELKQLSLENLGNVPPAIFQRKPVEEPREPTFNVFVYGSLLKGFMNHRIVAASKSLGSFETKRRYRMLSLGSYPAVHKAPKFLRERAEAGEFHYLRMLHEQYRPVRGEVYNVDQKTLNRLDALEGNGSYYTRELLPIKGFPQRVAWVYLLPCSFRMINSDNLVATDHNGIYSWTLHNARKKGSPQLPHTHKGKREQ